MATAVLGFRRLLQALDQQAIPYMIGGSVASSVHGVFRYTNNIDIVARVTEKDTDQLAMELAADFYADPETMREALRHGRAFNLIHYSSTYKFDVFPVPDEAFYQVQFERRELKQIVFGEAETVLCPVATAEDTVLAKLVWYRAGGEQSERQWNDLRGVCAVQGARLDRTYMRKWARHLGVEDLLERLLGEGLA